MDEKVKLMIRTKQIPHDPNAEGISGEEASVFEAMASYYQKQNSHYLIYEEALDGYPTPFQTRLKVKGESLELYRAGAIKQRMLFEEGNAYCTEYVTPYGTLMLEMRTKQLDVNMLEEKLSIIAEYDIYSNGNKISENRIEITAGSGK